MHIACTSCVDGRAALVFRIVQFRSALLLAQFFNQGLPERFAKSNLQIIQNLFGLRRLTKRELLKITHQEWAAS